jgi:hypothetical protein
MAASVILNRLMYVLWRNAEVPVDSLWQFLIEFAMRKTTDHSWWRFSRQSISYRPSESCLPRRANYRCLLVPGSIASYWFMTASEEILDHCALTTGFSLDHWV